MKDFWFFFSYAHADQNSYLDLFYKDLASEVRTLTGAAEPESGFLDRKDIEHGAVWDAALESGLQNSKIFVPIYSGSYFQKLYCGKEFGVFQDRLAKANLTGDPLILPVLWTPEANVLPEIPKLIDKIQYKHGNYPPEYLTEGVLAMNRLGTPSGKFFNQYWGFVREFAKTIVATARAHPLPKLTVPLVAIDKVKGPFPGPSKPASSDEGGPRYVQFIFGAGNRAELKAAQRGTLKFYGSSGSDWQPYLDQYQGTAESLAREVIEAVGGNSRYEEVALTSTLYQQVEQAASQDKIVVVLVDTWTLLIEKYYDMIAPLDHQAALNCLIVVVWNDQDQEASVTNKANLEKRVSLSFDTKLKLSHPSFFPNTIKSYDSFKSELARAVVQAQAEVVTTAQKKKDLMFTLVKPTNDSAGAKPFF
jgi:FxsC-like protein